MNKIQILAYLWLVCTPVALTASCPEVDGLNSPISIFHEHIETLYKQLSVSSTADVVNLIYFSQKDIVNLHSYQMIFSRKSGPSGVENYVGIATQPKDPTLSSLAIPHAIVKYIESDNINEVQTVLGVREDQSSGYKCDDFKSKFGTFLTQRGQFSFSSIWQNQASWVRRDADKAPQSNKPTSTQKAGNSATMTQVSTASEADSKSPASEAATKTGSGSSTVASTSNTSTSQTITNNGSSNSNSPFMININNQISGSPAAITPPRPSVATSTPSTSSTSTTVKTDDDLNFNYNFVNNWYDSFVSSLPTAADTRATASATANSNSSVTANGRQSSAAANANASVNVNNNSRANSSNRIVVTPTGSPSDTRISQTQNTEVNSKTFVNNNFGSQTMSFLDNMPTYRDIPDTRANSKSSRGQRNAGIDTLVEKGMTYEQILAILRKNKQDDEIQKHLERKRLEEEEQKKRNAHFLKAKEEQELIQKLYLILAYRKRQEDAQAAASSKVRPTEFLYNNLYGAASKLPSTLGQQTLFTIVPDGLGLNTTELSTYLNLSSGDLAKIITLKEQQYGNTLGSGKRENNEWSANNGSSAFGNGSSNGNNPVRRGGPSILDTQTINTGNAFGVTSFRQ